MIFLKRKEYHFIGNVFTLITNLVSKKNLPLYFGFSQQHSFNLKFNQLSLVRCKDTRNGEKLLRRRGRLGSNGELSDRRTRIFYETPKSTLLAILIRWYKIRSQNNTNTSPNVISKISYYCNHTKSR